MSGLEHEHGPYLDRAAGKVATKAATIPLRKAAAIGKANPVPSSRELERQAWLHGCHRDRNLAKAWLVLQYQDSFGQPTRQLRRLHQRRARRAAFGGRS